MVKHLRAPLILLLVFGISLFLLPRGASAQQDPIEVFVDIKPGSCPNPINVMSRGVLPVAILGTGNFDVNDIDPKSIRFFFGEVDGEDVEVFPVLRARIEDVATPFVPEEGEILSCGDCTDAGPDGYPDLTLKFRTQDVVKAIEALFQDQDGGVPDETCITIVLEGSLNDGTPIVGEDVVRILKKGRGNMPNFQNRANWPPPNWPPFLN